MRATSIVAVCAGAALSIMSAARADGTIDNKLKATSAITPAHTVILISINPLRFPCRKVPQVPFKSVAKACEMRTKCDFSGSYGTNQGFRDRKARPNDIYL